MTTQPIRPEHADKTEAIKGVDPRLTITRHLAGYAYPANGNVPNPTPRYEWALRVDGRLVDSHTRKGPLVAAAKSNGAAYIAEVDGQ